MSAEISLERSAPSVVALGGGHGLARALSALRLLGASPTAVVTVADDGGSSGRLRRDLGIIAPGDLRMALLALARDDAFADALAHRFASGDLAGHALGNLLLVALAERRGGDFVAALDEAGRLLRCAGRVLPATTSPVQLHARIAGAEVEGQVRVMTSEGPIEQVWLSPRDAAACGPAIEAIDGAELIMLGPGSLFTSVLATLLAPGIADAVMRSAATVVYVANISTQPIETAGFDARAHVAALVHHLPGLTLDAVVLHDGPPAPGPGAPIGTELEHPAVRSVVTADLLARDDDDRPASGHDPLRLAGAVELVLESASGQATATEPWGRALR
ncbi:MAG TPA: gluconeogenesis factor YvcK family protein [Egibacteraceae bacterium]|nr:gluconeogenesis factor YvcK family protein [Egibacteraceae bacterium]